MLVSVLNFILQKMSHSASLLSAACFLAIAQMDKLGYMLASAYFLGFSFVSPPVLSVLGQHEALPHAAYLNLALLTVSCIFVSYERRGMLW